MKSKKEINMQKYSKLLEKENENLKQKMCQLEKERDQAISEKKRAIGLLDSYKREYESLIADSKRLIKKQKQTENIMNKITEDCKKELEHAIQQINEKKVVL